MTRVLGIDPGSRITGYGVVDEFPGRLAVVACGCIKTEADSFPERLRQIYQGIFQVVEEHTPTEIAIEQVFAHKNMDSALKLGQARGAAICGGIAAGLPVHEYAAREVKLALVGKGSAEKQQVQHMVRILLSYKEPLTLDASDALAVALCHLHHQQTRRRMQRVAGVGR
ncbi:crossover junction endodeoxyribonuclease RuvC [Methylolobus aquaticus]